MIGVLLRNSYSQPRMPSDLGSDRRIAMALGLWQRNRNHHESAMKVQRALAGSVPYGIRWISGDRGQAADGYSGRFRRLRDRQAKARINALIRRLSLGNAAEADRHAGVSRSFAWTGAQATAYTS